ncbi:MAG: hypothetical protein PHI87_06850 [Candidatus Methanomethylophilus sp.]|nr:hypothetical protein [Methanomethylophilus sp.]
MSRSSEQKENILFRNQNFESEQSLVDFFALLLKIDKRNNPYLYELKENNKIHD